MRVQDDKVLSDEGRTVQWLETQVGLAPTDREPWTVVSSRSSTRCGVHHCTVVAT